MNHEIAPINLWCIGLTSPWYIPPVYRNCKSLYLPINNHHQTFKTLFLTGPTHFRNPFHSLLHLQGNIGKTCQIITHWWEQTFRTFGRSLSTTVPLPNPAPELLSLPDVHPAYQAEEVMAHYYYIIAQSSIPLDVPLGCDWSVLLHQVSLICVWRPHYGSGSQDLASPRISYNNAIAQSHTLLFICIVWYIGADKTQMYAIFLSMQLPSSQNAICAHFSTTSSAMGDGFRVRKSR